MLPNGWLSGSFILALWMASSALAGPEGVEVVEVFVREDCARCAEAKAFLEKLRAEDPRLEIRMRDVRRDATALADLQRIAAERGVAPVGVPSFHVRGRLLVGFSGPDGTGKELRELLAGGARAPGGAPEEEAACPATGASCVEPVRDEVIRVPILGPLNVQRVGLPLFTIAVGLIDGFNPCAMWVLLFLLALLVNLHSRARMLAVGGTFVLVGGILYFLFMAAWLNIFLIVQVTRAVQVVLGSVALAMGALQLKQALGLKAGPSLSIPESAKPGIYARARRIVQERSILPALLGAAVLAALVNVVELLCTAGLPAVFTHVLTSHALPRWQYYGYLALYNAAYLLDDLLVLGVAVITSSRFKLQERGGRALKWVSAVVMLALGAVLLVRPALLAF